MNIPLGTLTRAFLSGTLAVLPTLSYGQDESSAEEFELSPFEVTSEGSIGYQARDTLAGSRLRTDLRDVANAVQVINQEFLQDTGANDAEDLLVYTTNTEVGGLSGNFSGVGDGADPNDRDARTEPQNNTRVRGLDSADNTRNFFLTEVPWDGYNVERVDIQRGANAVLFGIGSPAGIINTDLIKARFYNSGEIEARIGSYGTYRGSFDINREIIDDELAIRVAGMHEDASYRQEEAFEEDQRLFLTARWDPEFLRTDWGETSFTFTGETGRIRANRPRILPPGDRITPWFGPDVNQLTVDPRIANASSFTEYERLGRPADYGLQTRNFDPGDNGSANPNYNPWITRFAPVFGPIAVFEDPNSPDQSRWLQVQGVDLAEPRPVSAPPPAPSLPFNQWVGIAGYRDYAAQAGLPGSDIGAIKNRSLTDPSVFDFYDHLLDGPTKYENDDFDTYNLTIRQGFLDNMFGLEFVFDHQDYERESSQTIADDGYAISVDMQRYLYNSSTADQMTRPGVPSPNVGRPFVAARGQNGFRQEIESESLRFTGFANLDLSEIMDRDNLLTRIVGRHVFTGLYTETDRRQDTSQWYHSVVGDGYQEFATSGIADYSDGRMQTGTISYLGGDMRGFPNPSQASISPIGARRVSQSGTTQLFDWTIADPSVPRNPVNLGRYVGYRDAAMPILHSRSGDRERLLIPANTDKQLSTTESQVFVWQGFLLDGLVVPTLSWREDIQTSGRSGPSELALNTKDGSLIFEDPEWYIPGGAADAADESAPHNRAWNRVKDETVSWGIVVHAPEFITRHLPYDLNFSVFYNDSENFRPDATRVDLYGRSVPSPTGSTEDYGFSVSALEDRIVLKVNWYESVVENANLAGAIANNYIVGFGEFWGYQFARQAQLASQSENGEGFGSWTENYALVENEAGELVNELDGGFLAYQPGPGQSIEEAYAAQQAAINALLNNPAPPEFQDAWGFSYEAWEATDRTGNPGPSGINGNLAVLSTNRSEGVEIELSAQVTPNWNLTFNAAQAEAIRDNIAENYATWVEDRFELYQGPAGDVRLWNGSYANAQTETVRAKFTREFYGNYLQQRQLQGSIIPENREWRFNFITNYSFSEGLLRGMNIGGAYRWQDNQVVGYPVVPDEITGYAYDIDNPIMGPTESNFDFWVGYQKPINDSIDWRIQLNVRNAFGDTELVPVTVQPDGSPGIYRIKEGTTWFVTNTFSF